MVILKFQMSKICVLPNWFNPSSKRTCIVSFYIILPSFIKIGQKLFEIIDKNTHWHTHSLTHRHIHADENNTCPKSKILGQVIKQARWTSMDRSKRDDSQNWKLPSICVSCKFWFLLWSCLSQLSKPDF